VSSFEYAIFDTSIGRCALAWGGDRIEATQLPERDDGALYAGLVRKVGHVVVMPPTVVVRAAIDAVRAHLDGGPADLASIPLALDRLAPFTRRVVEALRHVPRGQVVTYAQLAEMAGSPRAARAVGQAMAKNRWPIVVPCHRVVASSGPGGFSAGGGLDTKRRLLALEGALLV
jgi:methylated-DNA-[protein]-cysteine S-methyltransferase